MKTQLYALAVFVVSGYELTILHTNDVHSHYDQANQFGTDCSQKQISDKECYGGLARLKTAIDAERMKHPKSLLLDAGDQFQGTLFFTYYRGNLTARAMNHLGYDAMTLGNHEFDLGPENVARVASQFQFPVVSSNIHAAAVPSLDRVVKPYHLFPEHGVALVGYITYTAPDISNIGGVQVEDPVVAVQRAVDQVRLLGYTRVIAVSHNGYYEDMELASQVRGLSLIVGGHSHSYLASNTSAVLGLESLGMYPTKVTNGEGKATYVVQAYCWGRFLGHIDVDFGSDGYIETITGAPIELNADIELDMSTQKVVTEMRKPFNEYANQVIGETLIDLDQSTCQAQECNMGSILADMMLDYRPHAQIAFINAGGARASIPKGPITLGNVLTVLPFNNAITEFILPGQRVWDFIYAAVLKKNPYNNKPVSSFIQVAGMHITINKSQLVSVDVKDKTNFSPLDLAKNYTVVTLNFLAKGGDNIITPPILGSPTLDATHEVFSRYIKANSPIASVPGNRIIFESE
ncbi:hypothetical protein DSO57_1028365 [Entomophthora muscae]|uniref:Uncharacterized protein n=1 Tax=Entomophthora muscae TaxID=34485 RepID=A0ACC2RSK5_9FUNG|nr:hypothetical protein DSO57_1028365 [Entomophthora muscae]